MSAAGSDDANPLVATGRAGDILAFWFRDGVETGWPSQDLSALWFRGGPPLDQEIDQRFGDLVRLAVAGGLPDWEAEPLALLALVVLLDQFTRNVFRARAEAFSGDARAQALVLDALARGWDTRLPLVCRAFFYMPLVHAEDLALQYQALSGLGLLVAQAGPARSAELQSFMKSAQEHCALIATFGRFPHRNAVLGRPNSAQETRYLEHGPRFGQ